MAKDSTRAKKLIKKTIYLSLIMTLFAFIYANPISFRICEENYAYGMDSCLGYGNESAAPFFFLYPIVMIFISLISLFLHEQILYAWLRFSVVYVPLAILFILNTTKSYEWGSWLFSFDETALIGVFTLGLYSLISLILIARKSAVIRKRQA